MFSIHYAKMRRMSITKFHPLIQEWFSKKFGVPTEIQSKGWKAINGYANTLIAAPTGSGKTLAAFLTCIDTLVRLGTEKELPEKTQVVYVSPLKALSNDIQKNLSEPLAEMAQLAEENGWYFPEIRIGLRTGDTKPSERQKMAKTPPHILITTPESLYILLTSKSGRLGLEEVNTVIIDEIHAMAGDKRGSHLALSIERLCVLSTRPITRIGLSATQNPIEETARLLVGTDNIDTSGNPDCSIVETDRSRPLDLDLHIPSMELGPIASHELWDETLDTITHMVRQHQTTLVFCNTRRMVERVSHQLSDRLGPDSVVPHHGSLSRTTRLKAEEKLKSGQVQVCVATASLELGIDIGEIDLVCQLGSPRSFNLVIQRVGRSGHAVGGIPKGRLFPLTRDELVECTALLSGIRRGTLDTLNIPEWPLDVLAQQIIATCSTGDWYEDELFELTTKAYPYKGLPRDKFDQVIESLSSGFAPRLGRRGSYLHRDGINHRVKARRGAGIAAMTSGGTIPENADYDVITNSEEIFVGTVNEDFAIESLAGDIFLLGNTPWKIKRVEKNKVRVDDAQGQAPSIPFWLGESPGRTTELSEEVSRIRTKLEAKLDDTDTAANWIISQSGISIEAARQLVAYLQEGKRVLGMIPTGNRIIAERFFDESGGMQLVIHSPLGTAINRAWGMSLRKQICRSFDFELQAAATDDGLNFSLGPGLSFPIDDIFDYIKSRNAESVLSQAILQSPLFGTRWRWSATRALAILRFSGGKKVPPPLQRMRSDDLLAAVFPAQVACQDNAMPGEIEIPDHPLTFETMRDCLTQAMDLHNFVDMVTKIEQGTIEVYGKDTVQPSVFAQQILNAQPYAFLDDAPLEERRARAVSLRRALPDNPLDLGSLDQQSIEDCSRNAWPRMRDKEELHDALLILGLLPDRHSKSVGLTSSIVKDLSDKNRLWFQELSLEGRAHELLISDSISFMVSAEKLSLYKQLFPKSTITPTPLHREDFSFKSATEDIILELLRGWVECSGPITASELANTLHLELDDVNFALGRLEGEGLILRGNFTPRTDGEEFCDRRILARIHNQTIGLLRKQIEPATPAQLFKFLFKWQHVHPKYRLSGEGGILDSTELLQGFESPAGVLERELISARLLDYHDSQLDQLCLSGDIVWGRFSRRNNHNPLSTHQGRSAPLTRSTPISLGLRESLPWLLNSIFDIDQIADNIGGASREILGLLNYRGALFISEIAAATNRLRSDVDETLWKLAAAGLVTADGFSPLRDRIEKPEVVTNRYRRARRDNRITKTRSTRWSLLSATDNSADDSDHNVESTTKQLLSRYGIIFPELLVRESIAPPWRHMVRILRRMEAKGEIRGGRFINGFIGEQFATPEAIEMLRSNSQNEGSTDLITLSACDPLNLIGILTPDDKIPAVIGNKICFRDGVAICSLSHGQITNYVDETDPDLIKAQISLGHHQRRYSQPPVELLASRIGN